MHPVAKLPALRLFRVTRIKPLIPTETEELMVSAHSIDFIAANVVRFIEGVVFPELPPEQQVHERIRRVVWGVVDLEEVAVPASSGLIVG